MSTPFSAFGLLLIGFLIGVAVCLFSGALFGVYREARKLVREEGEQRIKLHAIREEARVAALNRITDKINDIMDKKARGGTYPPYFHSPFPVKEPEKPLQPSTDLPYTG